MRYRIFLFSVLLQLFLSGCATVFNNEPQNEPLHPFSDAETSAPRDIVGEHAIGLSLSGGGMRAAAFAFGVVQALAVADAQHQDVFDDITFISSVSGGSLLAADIGLRGRDSLGSFKQRVLDRNLERDLRSSLFSISNINRLFSGGLNDRSNLAKVLDEEVYEGATFSDLFRRKKPEVWINATDLYNRIPFPFTPAVFSAICSDLSKLPVSEAVSASMAVPLAFTPVVLRNFAHQCPMAIASGADKLGRDEGGVSAGIAVAIARALRNYSDPERMRYVKLADGGLTDNQGLTSILVARKRSGTPYGPMTEADMVRLRRMLFLIVDAGRPPSGDWATRLDGPSGVQVALAAADSAIDSATRLSATEFQSMMAQWELDLRKARCALPLETVRRYLPEDQTWSCNDIRLYVSTVSIESLREDRSASLREIPTTLFLPPSEIDAVIQAGRDAALANSALKTYLKERFVGQEHQK